jgi:radical SAM superfamily enzyme YgiQ (UPF0313 family)
MKAFCLSIDIVNADKPTASLAFLAGVCEHMQVEYDCASLNAEMLQVLSRQQFQGLYDAIKLGTEGQWIPSIESALLELVNKIKLFDPDVLLVSFFSFMQLSMGKYFLSMVKHHMPHLQILAGGPGIHATETTNNKTNGRLLCEQGVIDYYVLGEGDEVLPAFLLGERNLLGLNSLAVQHESWVPQISNLDEKYILPSYKKINFGVYQNIEAKQMGVINISTSRGCVRACTFCDVSNTWPKFRFRSGHKVAQEVVKHWEDTGIPNFYISDSLINGSLKSFKDFNLEMIKLKQQHAGLKDFSYNGMFIVRDKKSHNEEFFANMASAGCESIAIGVETGSDRLRAVMAKKFSNEDLDWHMAMCQKYKIRNILLMFTGHPQETSEDFQQSLDLLDRYQKYLIDDTIIGINFSGAYSFIPGTPDWEHREHTGIEVTGSDGDMRINWINKNNPTLTVKERVLRDLKFRQHAVQLRYGMPYNRRYIEYLKHINADFIPVSD